MATWREEIAPAVREAIRGGLRAGFSGRDMRAHLRASFPFGERANHPYRIWLDEVRRQLRPGRRRELGEPRRPDDLPGQGRLFE